MRPQIYKTFNSGRFYAKEGQWITFVVYNSGVVFVDHTRMIQGQIDHCNPTPAGLLEAYDLNAYDYPLHDKLAKALINKMQDMAAEI